MVSFPGLSSFICFSFFSSKWRWASLACHHFYFFYLGVTDDGKPRWLIIISLFFFLKCKKWRWASWLAVICYTQEKKQRNNDEQMIAILHGLSSFFSFVFKSVADDGKPKGSLSFLSFFFLRCRRRQGASLSSFGFFPQM
jgi:hypothetical protein